MKVWQVVILLLLLGAVISTGFLLSAAWRQMQARQQSVEPAALISGNAVQLLSPGPQAIYRLGDMIPVEIAVTRPGYLQVDLCVDGLPADKSANPNPEAVPWFVEFLWMGPTEGSYLLTAQARDAAGMWAQSVPVTITIVPAGQLFFASNRDGAYAIYGMASDGRNPVRLTTGPGGARHPCAMDDGALVYAADSGDGRSVIYLALAGGEPAPIVAGVDPACSADGGRLAYAAGVAGTSQVLTVYPWGGAPRSVTAEPAYAGQPAWAPDGSHIAYMADHDGNWDIWVVPAVGGEAQRLTEDPARDWAPAWSPDGTRLAFVSDREGSHQVYTMQVDGTRVERVTDLPDGAESPAWSPDGFWLAFVGYGEFGTGVNAREVYLVRADGRYPIRLTHNRSDDTDVAWALQP
ncbi:MAG: PD40 domain-containing protein [Anaerolineae bacterium]|nr:PD40 domain-containing protein [Anaerolineae bacterium]